MKEGQKEEEKPRKEPDKKRGKKEVESKRKNFSKQGLHQPLILVYRWSRRWKEEKKVEETFKTAHRRNMLKGQHEKEVADRKRKQEEQMETGAH